MSRPALVLTGVDQFAVEQLALEEPVGDEVAVDIDFVGLCGTDLHIVEGSHPRARFPLVLGHELVGRARAGPLAMFVDRRASRSAWSGSAGSPRLLPAACGHWATTWSEQDPQGPRESDTRIVELDELTSYWPQATSSASMPRSRRRRGTSSTPGPLP